MNIMSTTKKQPLEAAAAAELLIKGYTLKELSALYGVSTKCCAPGWNRIWKPSVKRKAAILPPYKYAPFLKSWVSRDDASANTRCKPRL